MIPRTESDTTLVLAIRLNSANTMAKAKIPPRKSSPSVPKPDPTVRKKSELKMVPYPSKTPATIQRQIPMIGERKKIVEMGLAKLPVLASDRSRSSCVNDHRSPPKTDASIT